MCLILPTLETILKPTCCFKLNSPGFRWGTAVSDLRSLQCAESHASAYLFKHLQILRLSSQSITHFCQSASSSLPPSSSSSLCTKTRGKSFIHDTRHSKTSISARLIRRNEEILLDAQLCPNGATVSFPIWNRAHVSLWFPWLLQRLSLARLWLPPTLFFFLFFFQTFAEHSCETYVTHRVEGVVQLIHYIDKAVEMPSESRVS